MEKQRAHLYRKNNKIRPKTPLNKRQNSNKSFRQKNVNHNNQQRKSPKTIEYNKLTEKYGNMIDNIFDKSISNNCNEKKIINKNHNNRVPTKSPDINDFYNKYNLNKTELDYSNLDEDEDITICSNNPKKIVLPKKPNQKQKIKIPMFKKNSNIEIRKNKMDNILRNNKNNKNNNIVINRYNTNNNFNNKNKNENTEFEKLKNQINTLKKENEKLKSNTITHNNSNYNNNYSNSNSYNYINDKLLLLLNLCRKYAKKLNKLYPLCDGSNQEVFEELKNTIIQYDKMIFSDKITNLFKYKNNSETINEYETLNPLDMSEFETKSITINITDKYKNLITKLKEENNEIKNKLIIYEEKYNDNNLFINNNEYKNLHEKMENILNENNNLKNQIKEFTEKESKYICQNNIIENLKCQIESLNNTIRYKDNIINNLQNILEKHKINPNLYNSESSSNSMQKNNNNNDNILNNIKNINQMKENNDKEVKINFPINNNTYNYLKENDNNQNGNNKINRYENNNNIISKITISTIEGNAYNNYQNLNSNKFSKKNTIEDINNNLNINQDSKDIIYKLKENLKKKDMNDTEDEYNIMTPYKKGNINVNENIISDENFCNNIEMKRNFENDKNNNKKEQIILNNEIEQLDQEILNLKSKLTQIIKK